MRQGDQFQTSFVLENTLNEVKANWSATQFQYISIALNLAYGENKLYKVLDNWSRNMFSFDFLEKGLGKDSPPHFVYDF